MKSSHVLCWNALRLVFGFSFAGAMASKAVAAPSAIEGVIDSVQVLSNIDPKYVFSGKKVKLIYLVGHMYGKDYKWYKYMVVQDSTKLDGISYEGLKKGVYVRLRSRAEPPGMVGKPIEEIRASRYGACEHARQVDTVFTPREIGGQIVRIENFSTTERVLTIRETSRAAREFKYLVVDGKSSIARGKFADLKSSVNVKVSGATINVPGPVTMYCSILHSAHLYAASVGLENSVTARKLLQKGLRIVPKLDGVAIFSETSRRLDVSVLGLNGRVVLKSSTQGADQMFIPMSVFAQNVHIIRVQERNFGFSNPGGVLGQWLYNPVAQKIIALD